MNTSRKYIFGGNWKLQIPTVAESVKIAREIAEALGELETVDVFIAPSANALLEVGKAISGSKLKLAAQNMHYFEKGAFTGELSVLAIKEAGAEYVLIGHSERRRIFQETDEDLNKKVKLALEHGVKVIFCIGETARERENGQVKEINEKQLEIGLMGVEHKDLENIVIAYEPVWAINNEYLNPGIEIRPATVEEAQDTHDMIRNWLAAKFGDAGNTIRIQYGGSMKAANAEQLLAQENIDGGLIGGASLKAETFIAIFENFN